MNLSASLFVVSFVRTATHFSYLAPSKPPFIEYQIPTILFNQQSYLSAPKHFQNYFERNSHSHLYSTRRRNDVHIFFCGTCVGRFSEKVLCCGTV